MKRKITTQFAFAGLAALLLSCYSTLEKKYNAETVAKDIEALGSELDSSEFGILLGSVIRLEFEDKKLEEMTYAEILTNGKKWKAEQERIEAEQKALAAKAAFEQSERIRRLNEAVMVTCFEKGFEEVQYRDYITFKFAIQNKSDKAIRAVKGIVTFTNLFDEKITSINFVYDQSVSAGRLVNWNATIEYNQFLKKDQTLRNKDLKDLKVVWKPEKIIFEDGSTLE